MEAGSQEDEVASPTPAVENEQKTPDKTPEIAEAETRRIAQIDEKREAEFKENGAKTGAVRSQEFSEGQQKLQIAKQGDAAESAAAKGGDAKGKSAASECYFPPRRSQGHGQSM